MPKTPSNKLFTLIKSMSGSEKRYFKLFAHDDGHSNNKYILLFDAIDQQDSFDEAALKATIYAGEPIESRKYSELKAYLYDSILKSLRAYDEKSSVDFRIKSMLLGVRSLFNRSLYDDCRDLLHKVSKLAYRYEQFGAALEILDWKKQIAYAQTDIAYLDRELDGIREEEAGASRQLSLVAGCRNLFLELLVRIRIDSAIGPDRQAGLPDIRENTLLREVEKGGCHTANVLYLRIYSLYYYARQDFKQFYAVNKELLQRIESQPHLLEEDVSEYISSLSNFMRSSGELGKDEEIEQTLTKLKNVRPKNPDDELKIHRQYYQIKFSLCIHRGDFQKGMQALQAHFRERKKFDPQFFENNSFYYSYFYISFGAGDYTRALEFLNQWLNLSRAVERQDLQSVARMLNLIVHYELGNHMLLESLIRSTYRFLKKRNKLHDLERKLIAFIREAAVAYSKQDVKKALVNLKQYFDDLSANPLSGTILTRPFNIMAWLESKMRNQSFASVVQEKYQLNQREH